MLLKLKAMSQDEGLNIVTEVVPALIHNWTENINWLFTLPWTSRSAGLPKIKSVSCKLGSQ